MALRLPPPWMIVLTGLVLNILAIVVSSLVLDKMWLNRLSIESVNRAMFTRFSWLGTRLKP